jgi:hypothetical protein
LEGFACRAVDFGCLPVRVDGTNQHRQRPHGDGAHQCVNEQAAPVTKPSSSMVVTTPASSPHIEAAKITPAVMITPLVERRARITPVRVPRPDSSRIRVISSKL